MRSLLLVLLLCVLTAFQPAARGQVVETIFSDIQGRSPWGKLVQGNDGCFYGTTRFGGATGNGTIFKITPDGVLTTLVSFNVFNGSQPYAGLVKGSDGNFYGTTYYGGAYGVSNSPEPSGYSGYGTIFKVTPGGVLTTLVSFNSSNGSLPAATLVEGSDGNFYGTTSEGGRFGGGTFFKMTPDGSLTSLVSFNSVTNNLDTDLVVGSDDNFYGVKRGDGSSSFGKIVKVTPAGGVTTLVSFTSPNGLYPNKELLLGRDGNFYGTTSSGGANSDGTVFKMTPNGELSTLVSFKYLTTGSKPAAGLVEGSDGNFYGTTQSGGANGYGTIFKMTPAGEVTMMVSFDHYTNGSASSAALVEGSGGVFYGTTVAGGKDYGTVFKVTASGALTTLVSFNANDGSVPYAGLLIGSDGNFYGTSYAGGEHGYGTVFKVAPSGVFTTLASFNGANGGYSQAGLVEGNDGNFYGTTYGVSASNGNIFKVTPSGTLTEVASFNRSNGSYPYGGLVKGDNGDFFGTTFYGGANTLGSGLGTIFKVTPEGEIATLVSFNNTNGASPAAGLMKGSDGNFYGTTLNGGANGYGTVFKMTPAGELTTLVSFGRYNGSEPYAGLVEGSDGNFYGTTQSGGANDCGTVYRVTPSGVITTLTSFNTTNGRNPMAGLVEGSDGNFYGATVFGGAKGYGTIFRVTPAGELKTLYSFDGISAAYPRGTPIFGSDGKLYGTASQMAIWRLQLPSAPEVATLVSGVVTRTSATLTATVNPNAADTIVTFEYGLTSAYSNNVVATPEPVTGANPTAVSATLSGLTPHTTYYYRVTASNSEGATNTTSGSFTTANSLPVANNDSFIPDANDFGAISLEVLGNDNDGDGDQLTITTVTQGAFGTVTTDGTTLTYTPGPGFVGRDSFSYTVSDGFDTATAQVELRPAALFIRGLLSNASQVPGAGHPGSGIPGGAMFKSFGVPSINSAGRMTFVASYAAAGTTELSVFALDSMATTCLQLARRGQPAPGTQGALFASFKDPLLNEAGEVAFLAMLSGGDTTKANKQGLWLSSFHEGSSPVTQLVARTGAQAPGVPAGARWKSFTSVALSSGEVGATADRTGRSLAFTAFMSPGAGGVSAANDMGLWIAKPEGTVLALREGQTLQIGGTEKKLRSFAALMALPSAPGQGNGVTSTGGVSVQAFFTDGSQAVLRVSGPGEDDSVTIEALGLAGDPVAGISETAVKFGIPAQSSSGAATAWLGSLSGKGNTAAIFERNLSEPELLQLLARKGDATPGIEGASFSAFRSVAVSDTGDALFLGKVSGRGISGSNDEGLWWKQGSSESASLQLLAREGAQPPGVPEGARWSSFTSLALSEGPYGPFFTAKLVAGGKAKGPGKITSANDQGLWAVDSKVELKLIVQEGQEVIVEGSTAPKTLKSFTLLSAVPGSPAQRRSFAEDGQIVYRALFTDGSQAIVKVQLP